MSAGEMDLIKIEKELNAFRNQMLDLRQDLEQNDHEIDVLQVQALEKARPWYRDASTMIAIMAFLFSLLTTGFSFYIAGQQRVHERKAELRILLQRINELNGEVTTLTRDFGTEASRNRFGIVASELHLLASQANEILDEIPGELSSVEYNTVAYAYKNLNHLDQAEELFREAIDVSNTLVSATVSYRNLAGFLMENGKWDEGRAVYEATLTVFDRYPSKFPAFTEREKAYHQFYWATTELGQNQCEQAQAHWRIASQMAADLGLHPLDPITLQLNDLERRLADCGSPGP
jgi:tetratricopeptide (TPR) repeat protein